MDQSLHSTLARTSHGMQSSHNNNKTEITAWKLKSAHWKRNLCLSLMVISPGNKPWTLGEMLLRWTKDQAPEQFHRLKFLFQSTTIAQTSAHTSFMCMFALMKLWAINQTLYIKRSGLRVLPGQLVGERGVEMVLCSVQSKRQLLVVRRHQFPRKWWPAETN